MFLQVLKKKVSFALLLDVSIASKDSFEIAVTFSMLTRKLLFAPREKQCIEGNGQMPLPKYSPFLVNCPI